MEVVKQVGLGCNFYLMEESAKAESKPMAELESENLSLSGEGFPKMLDPQKPNTNMTLVLGSELVS